MQPTYLPWVGYFDFIDQADVFILDDLSQYVRKSWHSRNQVRTRDGNVVWLTVPVHAHRLPLNEIRIDKSKHWMMKHWSTIETSYSNAPGWLTIQKVMLMTYTREWELLTDLTHHLIRHIALELGITTPIVLASELGPTRPGMAQRIVDLVHAVGANVLLDTPGAAGFLHQDMLEDIHLKWHHYFPHPYQQGNQPWRPHLSVIDAIAHTAENALNIVRNGAYSPTCEPAPQRAP